MWSTYTKGYLAISNRFITEAVQADQTAQVVGITVCTTSSVGEPNTVSLRCISVCRYVHVQRSTDGNTTHRNQEYMREGNGVILNIQVSTEGDVAFVLLRALLWPMPHGRDYSRRQTRKETNWTPKNLLLEKWRTKPRLQKSLSGLETMMMKVTTLFLYSSNLARIPSN